MRRRPVLAGLAAAPWAVAAASTARPSPRTLRIAFRSAETSFDPPQTNSDGNTLGVLANIFEAPLTYDYLARPVKLQLATAAAMPEVSADGRVFTVRLKPGIFFSDDPAFQGRPRELVAQDHVYALKRFYDPRWNSSDLYIFESLKLPGLSELREKALKTRQPFDYDAEVEGIRALDRYTFRITLGVPDPRFLWRLADAVQMGAVAREVVEAWGDDIGAHPVGTGPFRLTRWRRGSRLELERSPSWRGVRYEGTPAADPVAQRIAAQLRGRTLPLVDRVVVDIIEEDQPRWLAFLEGAHDLLEVPGAYRGLAAPGGTLAPFLARRGIRLQTQLQPDIVMSFFFMEHPLVGGYTPEKVALRRAIGLALDGESYRQQIFGGFGVPAQSVVPPHCSGYDASYRSEMSAFDLARARALLDTYGYVDRDGDGWREQPDGAPLRLVRSCTPTLRDRRINEQWKRAMDAIGLRIAFEPASWPELLKKSRAGTMMIWGYQWTAGSPDGGFFLSIAYGPNASEANDPRFSLPAFDRLFERQRLLPDGPEREALLRQAKNLLVAYMPYKVHLHNLMPDLVQPWVRNYLRHPFMREAWSYVDVGEGRPAA
ncbi:MAG: bicyclomycin resistance protein [Rubrivivax sp.]|nr:bicyclomycin resistance protein [Rubrivivax sp.]